MTSMGRSGSDCLILIEKRACCLLQTKTGDRRMFEIYRAAFVQYGRGLGVLLMTFSRQGPLFCHETNCECDFLFC